MAHAATADRPKCEVVPSSGSGARISTLDVVKGMAIILVVYGHVMQAMDHRGLADLAFQSFSDTLIYSFHMPTFFFVSGLFARVDSATPSGWILKQRASQILWPYVLWSCINASLLPFVGAYKATGHKSFDAWVFITDILFGWEIWFLWTLLIFHVVAVATRGVGRGLLLVLALVGYWVTDWVYAAHAFDLPENLGRILLNLPYFLLGARWSEEFLGLLSSRPSRRTALEKVGVALLAAGLAAFLVLTVAVEVGGTQPSGWPCWWPAVNLAQAAAGVVLLGLVAEFLVGTLAGFMLRSIGVASLAVFLMHSYPQGGARVIWFRLFGTDFLGYAVVAQTALAVAVPVFIYDLAMCNGGAWLFRYPRGEPGRFPTADSSRRA